MNLHQNFPASLKIGHISIRSSSQDDKFYTHRSRNPTALTNISQIGGIYYPLHLGFHIVRRPNQRQKANIFKKNKDVLLL